MRKLILLFIGLMQVALVSAQVLSSPTLESMLKEAESKLAKEENQIAIDVCNNALDKAHTPIDVAQVKLIQARAYYKMKLFEKSFEQCCYVLKMEGDFSTETRAAALTWIVAILNHESLADLNISILSSEIARYMDIPETYLTFIKQLAITNDKLHPNNQLARLKEYADLSARMHNESDENTAHLNIIQWYTNQNQFSNAIAELKQLIENPSQYKDKKNLCILQNNLGYLYLVTGNLSDAKENFHKAWTGLNCPLEIKPEIALNLANLFKATGDVPNMNTWAFEALTAAQKCTNPEIYAKALIANAYITLAAGDKLQAEELCLKALEILQINKNKPLLIEAYQFQAAYFLSVNEREQEGKYRQLIVNLSAEISQDEMEQIEISKEAEKVYWRIYSDVILQISKEHEAQLSAEKQRLDATNKEQSIQLLQKELLASEYERAQSDKARALRELEVAKLALDKEQQASKITSLTNERTQQELVMAQLELSKAEQEAELVEADRKNLELEKSDLVRNELLRKAQFNLIIGLVVGLFCVIGIIVSIVIIRRMKANNKLISHQKHELELNAIDIRSSLHSASQFQAALTPREVDINGHFKDANYIYYPLDIVSGDLPLCFSNETHTWIAAIDCIGHGVPAAMLTFTAHYTLKDIIQRNPNMSPSDVLEQLHRTIILSFDNKDEDAKFHSGMDISLVRVGKKNNTLDFAGAMSPMILQTKDGACQVIRGVRRSVADFSTPVDQKFETHSFELNDVKRFVLFSDGFIHQLNEHTQKIFSLARLLKIVQEQSNKTTKQLKETLIKEHSAWKGNYPQTDDILLLVVEN